MSESDRLKRKLEILPQPPQQSFHLEEREDQDQEIDSKLKHVKMIPDIAFDREINGPESLREDDVIEDGFIGCTAAKKINGEIYVAFVNSDGKEGYQKLELMQAALEKFLQSQEDQV